MAALVTAALLATGAPALADEGINTVAATAAAAAADAGVEVADVAPSVVSGRSIVSTTRPTAEHVQSQVEAAAGAAAALAGQAGLTSDETATIVQAVSQAAAEQADAVSTVALPLDADGTISVDNCQDQAPAVSISLPTTSNHADAKVASDGTVVYEDRTGSVDVAAQPLRDGSVRVQTVLNDKSAPTRVRLRSGSGRRRRTEDG